MKANVNPTHKTCGSGNTPAFMRENVLTFAEKRPHFLWKTSRLFRKDFPNLPGGAGRGCQIDLQAYLIGQANTVQAMKNAEQDSLAMHF